MQKKCLLFLFAVILAGLTTFGQTTATADFQDTSYNKYRIPSINAGVGIMTYYGDISSFNDDITHVGRFNKAFYLSAEQRINKFFGISLNALKGTLSETDNRPNRHLNFYTDVLQGGLNATLHIDNDFIISKRSRFSCFFTGGIGMIKFEPYGDFRDKNNNLYYYWDDGTIRDQAFDWQYPQNGDTLYRDYDFETKLDTANKYSDKAITLSLGGGINFKFSDRLEANISSIYYFTNTDAIDYKTNSDKFKFLSSTNDGYLYTLVSLQYNLGGKSVSNGGNKYYKGIDFKKIDKSDSDNDKVRDYDDECPDTPMGVKVDVHGCPFDDDKDGVPNYLDKESNTPLGVIVDEEGVTVLAKTFEDKYVTDSLIMSGALVYDRDSTLTKSDISDSIYQVLLSPQARIADNSVNFQIKKNYQSNNGNNPTYNTNVVVNVKDKPNQIGGVTYKVQIGSSSSSDLKPFFETNYNITEAINVETYQGAYKYSVGSFNSYAAARQHANSIRAKTNLSAFVIAFKDGARIPVSDAKVITGE